MIAGYNNASQLTSTKVDTISKCKDSGSRVPRGLVEAHIEFFNAMCQPQDVSK
jgi:hypothetical protein